MMKKLLILALVLGLTSAASAAFIPLTLTLNAPATADIGVEFEVTVVISGMPAGAGLNALGDGKIVVAGPAYTGGAVTTMGTFDGTNILSFAHIELNSAPPDPYAANGDAILTFKVTGDAAGTLDFTIDDKDAAAFALLVLSTDQGDSSYQGFGPLTVVGASTVVPEPATMLLLGLGGLFLRRRK